MAKKPVQTAATIIVGDGYNAFRAQVATVSEAATDLVYHGALVFLLECHLIPEGGKAKTVGQVKTTLRNMVVEAKNTNKTTIKERALAIYVDTAAALAVLWSGGKKGDIGSNYGGIVALVRDAKSVDEAIGHMRKEGASHIAKTGANVSLNGMRRWLGFSTGHKQAGKQTVTDRLATAVKSASDALGKGEAQPKAIAQVVSNIGLSAAPDVALSAIANLGRANDVKALDTIIKAAQSARDAAVRATETATVAAAQVKARRDARHVQTAH